MRLHGYCERCHKVKRVRVSNHGMAMLAAKRIPVGICDNCQEEVDTAGRKRPSTR